jgi:hypothetical protein
MVEQTDDRLHTRLDLGKLPGVLAENRAVLLEKRGVLPEGRRVLALRVMQGLKHATLRAEFHLDLADVLVHRHEQAPMVADLHRVLIARGLQRTHPGPEVLSPIGGFFKISGCAKSQPYSFGRSLVFLILNLPLLLDERYVAAAACRGDHVT